MLPCLPSLDGHFILHTSIDAGGMRRPGAASGALLGLLLLLCSGFSRAQSAAGTYDPCMPPTKINSGDPFVFGLAFWPGGTIAEWGEPINATSGLPGLNPCLTNVSKTDISTGVTLSYQEYLQERRVVFATYMIKVDTIAAVRTTRAEMDQIWRRLTKEAADEAVVSVIAFRGQNRSEAQYLRSAAGVLTDGTGIVQQLSLLVSWDRGTFNGFQWFNSGPCDWCGGLKSATCVQTQYDAAVQRYPMTACATPFEQCDCEGLDCPSNNCTTTVYVGHRGSDKSGRTMDTGYQIQSINKYSVTSLFWKLLDGAFSIFGNSGIGDVGSGTTSQPVVLGGATDAALAQGQAVQQAQGQPLAGDGSR